MKIYYPDRRSLTVLRVAVTAVALILIAAAKIFIKIYVLMLVLSIFFAAAAVAVIAVYLPLYFSNLSYHADENGIKKCTGVFLKKSQAIKYSSVQYSTTVQTPFSRMTGLNFLVFYVYGGTFTMLFLRYNDMQEILEISGNYYSEVE